MKLFFSYLKYHIRGGSVILLSIIVFFVIFTLYSLPFEPLLYSIALCATFSLPIIIGGFKRFKRKHILLTELRDGIGASLELLPEPQNIMERDYSGLIEELFEEKSRAESDMAASITDISEYYTLWAHQIKTPIAAMRLLLQSSEETEDTAELSEQLFRVEEYVDMVLNFVKSDKSVSDYLIRLSDLSVIVKGVIRKYRRMFIRKKITLEYTEQSIDVITDDKWIAFVIGQILSNSLKYTPSGGKIEIFSPDRHTLVIKDNGIGISPEDLPRVCEKGYTGFNGRADKKSTGIGLYLSKRVVDNLSHRLEISSVVGEGTTVAIRFPDAGGLYE